ncbi:hypothetical protein LTR10_023462 [Elasticomyces elasticus]|uniref:Uncharacterized protein n=1 Tax=Exophiala sideris TaxID=1016849 RepID=A0ABR0J9F4_9EURO|nr:hypothetical protein LTR10_023462 [Elasticomyces elasticus]KAK5022725.1 hypothetical protein LTS07_009702 [Exophiala sideris]KAK5023125.1 hypothetical protein LTR13_011302 [Exophiala sideris]KAK5059353.1 hypothetical protein LTR69_005941 [Exophiala sideris]KAK5176124.1 hypothetical protein LTR44_011338 [Eurotiomycetes sp. CCFEE 6388]
MQVKTTVVVLLYAASSVSAAALGSKSTWGMEKRDVEIEKREPEPLIPCSASVWLDNCTGWPSASSKRDVEAAPVAKREVDIIPNPEYKRSPAADFDPEAKRSEWQKRADIPQIQCSTEVWIDDCTGWYD